MEGENRMGGLIAKITHVMYVIMALLALVIMLMYIVLTIRMVSCVLSIW